MKKLDFRTRFAPSPTGPLHLGHAFSALTAYGLAQAKSGEFLLRIEDIDQGRSRLQWEDQIYDDLEWLGLSWPSPVLRQSDRMDRYRDALRRLWDRGLLFPCTCNRRDIQVAASAPQEGAPVLGPDGLIYPGTCRDKPKPSAFPSDGNAALRLDMRAVWSQLGRGDLRYLETGSGTEDEISFNAQVIETIGDIVLSRKDMGTSYHLSVVLDDADQQISHVVRGRDLAEATAIHVLLQRLLDLPTPIYHHHRLIRDQDGKRLAKRDDARAIATYRAEGKSPEDIRSLVGL